jgi:hypothetical protein
MLMMRRPEHHGLTLAALLLFYSVTGFDAALGAPAAFSALVAGAGTSVSGKVLVSGALEHPPALRVFKNRKFCGVTVPNETLLVGPGGALRNAVVSFTPAHRSVTVPPGVAELDNQRCAFVPHVQVASLGSDLILKNSDPILHTVHARIGKETLFNVGLPHWRRVTKRLERAGVVRIDCDVLHTWMTAAIVVVTTPYFAVTDAAGSFALSGLPSGEYRMEVWHERLGHKQATVHLEDGRPFALEIIYSAAAR